MSTPPISAQVLGITAQPPAALGGTSTKVTKYGLTNPSAQIYLGSLAPILGVKADPKTGMVNAIDALDAFAAADPTTQSQVQSMLKWAGFYASTASITFGRVSTPDLEAFAKSLNFASSAQEGVNSYNQNHPNPNEQRPAFDYTQALTSQASDGQRFGLQQAISNRVATLQQAQANMAQTPIQETYYNKDQVYTLSDQIGEKLLGRSLTPEEKADIYADMGAKNAGTVAKVRAKANLLDAAVKETEQAGQNLDTAVEGNAQSTAMPAAQGFAGSDTLMAAQQAGETGIRGQQFFNANTAQTPVTVDTYLAALRSTATNPDNPYGFTATTWSAYARQAGLGSDATMTAANQEVVARYLAMNMVSKYGSWGAVTAGFLSGPSAAQAYASNPDSTRWQSLSSSGQTVAGRINSVTEALNTTVPANQMRADLGVPTLGGNTGKSVSAAEAALGTTTAMPPIVATEAPVYNPADIIEQQLKETHPTEYGAHNLTNAVSNFLSLLGGITAQNVSGYGPGGVPS